MAEPYLIAHVVRGEPAFDIAEQMIVHHPANEEDEIYWIIPTSGHRAYPYWEVPLSELVSEIGGLNPIETLSSYSGFPPPDWPDHYSSTAAPKGRGLLHDLASRLGLTARPTVTRR